MRYWLPIWIFCKNKDIIIIRLGENVQDVTTFPDAISRLVKYCQSKAKRVIITGCFWKNDSKERSIIHAARTNDLTYVPLYWIDNLYNVRPQIVSAIICIPSSLGCVMIKSWVITYGFLYPILIFNKDTRICFDFRTRNLQGIY